MNVGSCTFDEFKQKAADFHGYPAPGLLVGGYMVEAAKRALPKDILFEALVETHKCLPDAVQLLTLCSTGNNWMKVANTGRFALSLYDKHTGEGVRVHLDMAKLAAFPELEGWLLKKKKKQDQDTALLWKEIEEAGDSICAIRPVRVHPRFLGHGPFSPIAICPRCNEAYPANDGDICLGCQGEAPYTLMPHHNADSPGDASK